MEESALLSEVYHVSKSHPLHRNYFGVWKSEAGIIQRDINFYERRNNLQGLVIRAAAITEPPVTILRKEENTLILEGFFGKIWKTLEKQLNFTTEFSTPEDQAWGSLTSNGTWNGMIGMILRNEVEYAVTEFTMTSLRAQVVDFSIPLIDTRNCVIIRYPQGKQISSWTDLLNPFCREIWIIILVIIVVTSLFPKITFYMLRRLQVTVNKETEDAYSSIYIIGIFFGADIQIGYTTWRILCLVAYLTAVTISVAYSAFLISFLTEQKIALPFNSLRELIDIKTYKLGVLANSGQLNNFNNATEPVMMEVYAKLIKPDKDNLPITIEEGMQRVCARSQ
ncbi:hypothetical protein L9F63_008847 [Diploptera punctata]|uniref:Ionotropic glutamate receptor L-glutamate and glycine-binding domain-containing protein n=1 Tax=Diploptera punctata TaxID=6984 RepID=A0AAD8E200_DIPPU|nr:hypothetical protein L9F63_008847 [Diploptera punctata]